MFSSQSIEEGFIQKARQTVVVCVWGARSYAALGIFWSECAVLCTQLLYFSLYFCWGVGMIYVDLCFKFKDRFYYFLYYLIC